jgi:hypothetical protein
VKRERTHQQGKPALELIEEAIHLLRSAPAPYLASYYLGALPFVLATLYFWGDMSRSPFAGEHLIPGSLSLALLFLWMKSCQTVFARQMRAFISGETLTLSARRFWHIFLNQAALQTSGLFVLPLLLLPTIPFPWAFAFYQNLVALDDGETLDFKGLFAKASRQARLWPAQNHVMLALLFAFAFFVFLNLVSAFFVLPALLKMFLGIETVFTRSGLSMLNSTLLAAALGLAYLCVDPILKTIYVLRCFLGESQRSGADLRAELRHAQAPRMAALTLIVLLAAGVSIRALADDIDPASKSVPAGKAPPAAVAPTELDRTIQDVIQQPKYAWREPRKLLAEDSTRSKGFFERLFERIRPFLKKTLRTVSGWIDAFFRRLFGRQGSASSSGALGRWVGFLQFLLYALIVATVAGLAWLLYRVWRGKSAQAPSIASEPIQPVPDLSDEALAADQLPEDGWLSLAQKLLTQGELRLALRAFYLATLAHLAGRNLIRLARGKSNRDYDRELKRRAHALPGLVDAFDENLTVFDRTWYGMYEINPEIVRQFADNVERIKNLGTNAGSAVT